MSQTQQPKTIHRQDYTPLGYRIEQVELRFHLGEEGTRVDARLRVVRTADRPLVLDGVELELLSLTLDGRPLEEDQYRLDEASLTLLDPPQAFTLALSTRIHPQANLSLEGLYQSGGNFCTQCEAEGFRKITYYPDRPDVLSEFTVTLVADRARYPVLLSNGNLIDRGEGDDGRHWATWHDPFPKPSYLFALVAGRLELLEDTFTTASDRTVALKLYVEPGHLDQCQHAMASLKKAMAWDEQRYGLEYDLDVYHIVAVSDFNMGAMENKSLNLFNTKYVLAKPETATDSDYQGVEGVIGHEYFHNWTGNRVTCRDWFQLSLKEGLTVFRDQEFSADMLGAAAVKRIEDVRLLRTHQFAQDAGPMAHPVRPDAYIEINNFYTVTIYNKGAEVIRMMQTLLGREGFRRGMDLYFARHDGQAVTCDDFVAAMADANGADFGQFKRWYSQAGTPELEVDDHYDPQTQVYLLTVRQHCPPTPGQPHKEPLHIPLAVGLLGPDGVELPLEGRDGTVLEVREAEQNFRFEAIAARPVPSLNRHFSAPVKLRYPYSPQQLAFLLAHDRDDFNRWEAGQCLAMKAILSSLEGEEAVDRAILVEAFARVLTDPDLHPAIKAELLTLPGESYLADQMVVVDVEGLFQARTRLRLDLGQALREPLLEAYREAQQGGSYRLDAQSMGRRALKNRCLDYLMRLDDPRLLELGVQQFEQAGNMTDRIGALGVLADLDRPQRGPALATFYEQWRGEPLVVDKWFALQATSSVPDTLDRVKELLDHPAFTLKNPNKVRALIGAFAQGNPVRFHDTSGAGYAFLADRILELDPFNPQIAARLSGALTRWRRYDPHRQALMRQQLERLLAAPRLSPDVYEIAAKSLE
ncbi:MAG: aminopeptidase N [Candidatus Competibacteraceae bacterium]|nr:aminopeptidase N [Candidatus Competibacteraceae bacterium]